MFLEEYRHVYEALTRHNYFPNQKEGEEELPPCFSTSKYTPELVEILVALEEPQERKKLGYDQVEYSLTRHNNVPRKLGLVHPRAHAQISKVIVNNWKDIKYICGNKNSMIKPGLHLDGRILIMDYEDVSEKVRRLSVEGFSKGFRVHSDISSCFHSVYTHSIPWAVLGFENSKNIILKKNKPINQQHWSEQLDFYARSSRRKETLGLAIGPASSSVIVELILGVVDLELEKKGFEFKRYIDDYVCSCDTHENAKLFIRVLGQELSKFKLNINLNKTKIVDLPRPTSDDWVAELSGCLPSVYIDENYSRRKYLLKEILSYLDMAVLINEKTPDGSVLKYAVKTIINNVHNSAVPYVLDYLFNLAWYFPLLIPHLGTLLNHDSIDPKEYSDRLNKIIVENAKNHRSDGMTWPLYFLNEHDLSVSVEAFGEVFKSKDCVALVCLYRFSVAQQHIVDFSNELLCKTDYEKDQYWLLLYELYRDDHIRNPYPRDKVFETLKKHRVSFISDANKLSPLEEYCQYINNPFGTFGLNPDDFCEVIYVGFASYEDWLTKLKKRSDGYVGSPKTLAETILPFNILSNDAALLKWGPLIERLAQVIGKENYYDWKKSNKFIAVLKAVISVQLKNMAYPEASYEFTQEHIIERSGIYFDAMRG